MHDLDEIYSAFLAKWKDVPRPDGIDEGVRDAIDEAYIVGLWDGRLEESDA